MCENKQAIPKHESANQPSSFRVLFFFIVNEQSYSVHSTSRSLSALDLDMEAIGRLENDAVHGLRFKAFLGDELEVLQ